MPAVARLRCEDPLLAVAAESRTMISPPAPTGRGIDVRAVDSWAAVGQHIHMGVTSGQNPFENRRRTMVETQLRMRGVRDERVLDAMAAIPRERFLPEELTDEAYEDRAVPIGLGQTISQPYIVAYMTEQLSLSPDCSVLEVGTGSGYQTAVLARLAGQVRTLERLPVLQERAQEVLHTLSVKNVTYRVGDGSVGWAEGAPYDRIVVTAAAPHVSRTLIGQLAFGGIMVLPVGSETEQTIVRVERRRERWVETPLLPCRFVRLIGREGWEEHS